MPSSIAKRLHPFSLSLALLAMGCYASASVTVRTLPPPTTLVVVGPGVWVVEDYEYAVFYANSAYWLYDGGVWYRSRYVNSGWAAVQISVVPTPVRRIQRPGHYVRYRARANVRTRRVPPGHVRDASGRPAHRAQPDRGRGRDDGRRNDDGRGRGRDDGRRLDDGRGRGRDDGRRHDDGRGRGRDDGRRHDDDRGDRGGPGPSTSSGGRGRSDDARGRGRGQR